MALQVWIPFIADNHNQGLSDTSVTAGTCTYSAGGVLGNAATFGGSSNNQRIDVVYNRTMSFACFVKFNAFNCHLIDMRNSNGAGLQPMYAYNYGIEIGGTGGYTVVSHSGGFTTGKWYHLCVVYEDSKVLLYVNGVFSNEASFTYTGYTGTFPITIGSRYSNANWFNGQINDFRVYDHALSAKEVKEISKGLVQHFKLNYLSINNQNSIIIEPDGSKWAHVVHHNNPGGGVFAQTDDFVGGVYKDANRWFKFYEVVNKLSTFEFMVKQKTTSSASEVKYRWVQNVSPIGATYEQVAPAQVTRITTNGYTNGNFGGLYVTNSNAHLCIANGTKGNWFGAFGSWTAYQNGTPGYPNTVVTTGYMDLYVRVYDDIVVVDCSGFGNDGTVYGMPTLDYSSPRYDACIVTSTNNCINAGRGGMIANAFSVSIWGHMSSWGSYSARLASCTEGGGWNFEPYDSKMSFISYAGAYARAIDNTALSSLSSGWHHFVGVFDGSAKKVYMYRDGVMVGSATTTNATTTYYSNNVIFIGAEAAANQTTPNGYYFPGKLSDFRIYGTALSAEDIAELYHTGASVDNKGNFFCGELKEE